MRTVNMKRFRSWTKRILIGIGLIVLLGTFVFVVAGLLPVEKNYVGEHHSSYVTMEDGTRLAVRYTLPSDLKEGERLPAIMEMTRYGTESNYSFVLKALLNLGVAHDVAPAIVEKLIDADYVYVAVDARGSGASFGTREMEWSREEADDMGTIIRWIAEQPWSNEKVGTYGVSYSGNAAEIAVASGRPELFAAAPLYPDFDLMRQIVMPGGIRNEVLIKKWGAEVAAMDSNKKSFFLSGNAPVDGDAGEQLLKEAVAGHHTIDIDGAFKKVNYLDDVVAGSYKANSLSPFYYKESIEAQGVPFYVRVGWQDAGTVNGAIARFLTYSNPQTLVIGPWSHAGWNFCDPFLENNMTKGELDSMQADEIIKFYNSCLQDESMGKGNSGKVIRYYTLGEGKWKTSNTWPVQGFHDEMWYFGKNGSLTRKEPLDLAGSDKYKIDFTASTGESNRWFTNIGGGRIVYSNRAEEDQKLLCYTSEVLDQDIEITGTPVVTLNVSSTSEDGAFYVYLEDVAPDGTVTYITEGQLRAIHRKIAELKDVEYTFTGMEHSYLKKDSELMRPGQNTEIKIGMYATSVLIKKGHKIRIAIAGHDAASFARIPEKSDPTIVVQRNSNLLSYVELPMMIRE